MKAPGWTVGDVARLARVTVRTLHHYDAIGLVSPSAFTESGYRLYGEAELARLHLVRLYRSAGLPLEQIRAILDAPGFDRAAALREHRERLLAQIEDTRALVASLDRLLGGGEMSERAFEGLEEEAEKRWGQSPEFAESRRRTGGYGPADWAQIKKEMEGIEARLASLMTEGRAPGDPQMSEAVEAHRAHMDRWYYPCSRQMHGQLGEMYVADPRFAAHYDARAPGLAVFLRDAIRARG
jgi:MerR family transcriptional regulator, thiopeptide resistance regulator